MRCLSLAAARTNLRDHELASFVIAPLLQAFVHDAEADNETLRSCGLSALRAARLQWSRLLQRAHGPPEQSSRART